MNHDTTLIPVSYRDNSHFRTWDQLVVPGRITDDQLARLATSLDRGRFIPEQIGQRHLGWQEPTFTTFPNTVDDHAWHELYLDQILVVDSTNPMAGTRMHFSDTDALLDEFESAATEGWSPRAFDPCSELTPTRSARIQQRREMLEESLPQRVLPGL